MKHRNFTNVLIVGVIVSHITSGCRTGVVKADATPPAPSKATQCRSLIDMINSVSAITQNVSANRPDTLLKTVTQLDQLARSLDQLAIQDAKLIELRSRYVKMYQAVSRSTRDTFSAIQQRDVGGTAKSLQTLQTTLRQDSQLVKDLNQACSTP